MPAMGPRREAPGAPRRGNGSWGSGLEPPSPPCLDVDPRPRQTSRNPAFLGRISPVFWALRCKVEGGWGGSAHYPDPTAQSASACAPRRATRHAAPVGPSGTPRAPVGPVPRSRAAFACWLVDLRPLRGGWTKVAAAPFGVGDPRPGTGVPSRARSSGLTTARVSLSLKVGLEPTGISMSSVRSGVPP